MKNIDEISEKEKMNLILYKIFRQEYIGSTVGIVMLSFLIIAFGFTTAVISISLVDFLPSTWKVALLLSWVFFISNVIWIVGVFLFGMSLYILDKKKKKLQLAFQAETIGRFDDVFSINNDDIKNMRRIWKIGEKK